MRLGPSLYVFATILELEIESDLTSQSHNHTPAHLHEHGHSHAGGSCGHSHAPANFNKAFAIGIALNMGFAIIEAFYGWRINSLALLVDAGHNLSDVAGLLLAWGGTLAV